MNMDYAFTNDLLNNGVEKSWKIECCAADKFLGIKEKWFPYQFWFMAYKYLLMTH